MSVRVYVPTTLPALAGYVAVGEVPVTEEVFTAADETEEAEYVALMEAADASAELIAGLDDGPGDGLGAGSRRRVVVVAELSGPGGPVPLSRVVAVHVDTEDDADPDDDLAWYATQEIRDLV